MKNAGFASMSLPPRFGPHGPWFGMMLRVAIGSSVMLVCPVPSSGREMVIPPTLSQCIVFGSCGARWDQSIMAYLDSLLEAVALDAASRGLPAIIGGDFNAQPHESAVLSPVVLWLAGCYWVGSCCTHRRYLHHWSGGSH